MIEFQEVTKKFGDHVVLDNLNLHCQEGKITFIIGKSGEGKSVTIKHMIGLMKPNFGKVIVDGQDVTSLSDQELRLYRRKFGMLFQQAALFDSLTVRENVLFPLQEEGKLSFIKQNRRLDEVLEQVGLPHIKNHFPSELSTGEKKRIGLARALIIHPKIILYDEPTTGMDPLISEMIDELIVKVNKEEKELTSVVISHDLKAALGTADHIVMLYKGQVCLEGSPKVFLTSNNPIVRQFFSGKIEGPMEFL